MSALIPMQFDGTDIRVVTDDAGEPWFVGKDVADALGYSNPQKAVRDHCRAPRPVGAGGERIVHPSLDPQTVIVSEPDVLRLIVKSNLPAAERFERWVFEEVLPAIRKTGGYVINGKDTLRLIAPEFRAALSIARTAGLKGNQATLSAAKAVAKLHGQDPLALIGATHLTAEVQVRHYTPTELGHKSSESAQAFNKRLERSGLQVKNTHGDWVPTPAGKPHAVLLDTGKAHSNGVPIQQLRWLESVLDVMAESAAARVPA